MINDSTGNKITIEKNDYGCCIKIEQVLNPELCINNEEYFREIVELFITELTYLINNNE